MVVFLGVPPVLLFTWTVLESFGFHHLLLQAAVTVMVLVCLPLGWVGAWSARHRAGAADNSPRERIEQLIATKPAVIVFRPIVDCGTRRPIGAEALSRFAHLEPKTEGVETEAELRTMRLLGVQAAQGYLTGPDLPSAWPVQFDTAATSAEPFLINIDRDKAP